MSGIDARRRSLRYRGYDYSQPGSYFVTICTEGRRRLFGRIKEGALVLSPAGEIVRDNWLDLPGRFAAVVLHDFVVMPNHFHGLLSIAGKTGAASSAPTKPQGAASGDLGAKAVFARPHLGSIIRAFKSVSAREVNRTLGLRDVPLWQRNYYERIVRGGGEFRQIQDYIRENAMRWDLDPENV